MGQASSSETLSISGGDGYRYWVGINMKPFGAGCKKTVFKGVLLGSGPRQWEKVIAKAFTDIPGTKEIWSHEVSKADLTRQLAASFLQTHRRLCKISVVIPGIVQMDKVSKANNWYANKNGLRGLGRSEWISVEEFIPGQMHRYCAWKDEHTKDRRESEHLQTFSHFTYKHSCGTLVACDFQGTADNSSSPVHYTFTDSIIHSSAKIYGAFDEGEYGITEFFKRHKCNDICRDWPKPTPLTPPPSFEQACALQLHLTPPPAFENIVFSSQPISYGETSSQEDGLNESLNRRRRHASAHNSRTIRNAPVSSLDVSGFPQRRRSIGSPSRPNRNNTLGAPEECIPVSPLPSIFNSPTQPPSYSSVCNNDLRRRSATFAGYEGTANDQLNDATTQNTNNQRMDCTMPPNSTHRHVHINRDQNIISGQQHARLTPTWSDPECSQSTSRPRSAPSSECQRTRNASGDVSDTRSGMTSSLRRRRMQTQKAQSSGSEDNDMVSFYLGELERDLPPLRVVPSAPPVED